MRERQYEYSLINGDRVIHELRKVRDKRYEDGIMYTHRCMSADGRLLFAVENSHGQPHIHWRDKKEIVDWNWKMAYWKFDEMLREHKRKIGHVD